MNELGLIDVLDWKKQLENQLRVPRENLDNESREFLQVELNTIKWVLNKLEVSE